MGSFSVSGLQISRIRLTAAYHDYLHRVLRAFEAGEEIRLVDDARQDEPALHVATSEVEIRSFFAATGERP